VDVDVAHGGERVPERAADADGNDPTPEVRSQGRFFTFTDRSRSARAIGKCEETTLAPYFRGHAAQVTRDAISFPGFCEVLHYRTSVSLHDPFHPTQGQREAFERDGHLTLRALLDPVELARVEPAISAEVARRNTLAGREWSERSTYERAFVQVMNLWRDDEVARQLVFSNRLAGVAASLLGVPRVRLYHDQALYKEPTRGAGGHTPWHVDQYYWPLASDRAVTAWIPLVDVPGEMGPLTFASGSHWHEGQRHLAISDSSESECDAALAAYPRAESPFAVGDVSFHLGWTFHCAPINRSERVRKVMTVIYIDAAMIVSEPLNEHQRADLATWLPGTAPGDVAASPINPLL